MQIDFKKFTLNHSGSLKRRIVIGIILLILMIYLFIESSNKGDFCIFLEASKDLMRGENIYEKTYFDGYHYFYSLLFAILIYPFTFFSSHMATFLWLCFNVFLLYRLYFTINKLLPRHLLSDSLKKWFWILSVLFSLRLILENLHSGQITIFLLYLCLEGLYLTGHKKIYKGALWIALGINIKLLPIVILPYLLYRKQFKAVGLIILFVFIFFIAPVILIGFEQFDIVVNTWINLINPSKTEHILDVEERSFHGLTTLLSTLFVENAPDIYALDIKRNVANVSLETLSAIIFGTRLFLIGFTLYFIRSKPFQRTTGQLQSFWEISYILCVIPLIFPHQQHYAFLFVVPAFIYCIYYLLCFKDQLLPSTYYALATTLFVIYLAVNLKLILGEFNPYYEHFKILTYGAILLIIVLSVLIPPKTLKNSECFVLNK